MNRALFRLNPALSNVITECHLCICRRTKVTHDSRRPDGVTSDGQVEIDAGELLKTRASAEPDDFCLSVIQSQSQLADEAKDVAIQSMVYISMDETHTSP